ncbi:MAG: PAS domain S-box protein [Deltaproteobacteria bacterium]|nr:PAS domain S-box protein [Deltaproteobacteria bacterium]
MPIRHGAPSRATGTRPLDKSKPGISGNDRSHTQHPDAPDGTIMQPSPNTSFFRKALALLGMYVIFVAVLGYLWIQHEERQAFAHIDARLRLGATSLKYLLANDFHDRATTAQAIDFDEEMRNRAKVNAFAATNGFIYAYTLVRHGDGIHFSAPTVTPEEAEERKVWYFYPYEDVPTAFRDALAAKKDVFLNYTDEWGHFRSYCAYETSPGGNPYLACADIEISQLSAIHEKYLLASVATAAGFLAFLAPAALLIRGFYRAHIKALRASKEDVDTHHRLLQDILAKLPVGLVLVQQDHCINRVNPAFTRLTGYTTDDVPTRTAWVRTCLPDRKSKKQFLRAWSARFAPTIEDGVETRVSCKDGTLKTFALHTKILGDGRAFILLFDLTERLQAEENMRGSEARLRQILDSLQVGIAVVSTEDLRLSYVNPKLLDMTGRSAIELLGSRCTDFICDAHTQSCPYPDQLVPQTYTEETLTTATGSSIQVLKAVIRTEINGKPVLVESFADITSQKRAEADLILAKDEAEAASRVKTEFLNIMSHEIRTPLNGIMTALQIMQTLGAQGPMAAMIDTSLQGSKALLTILSDILDLADLETETMTISVSPFAPVLCVDSVLNAFREEARRKGLELTCWVDPTLADPLIGDLKRIRQVLFNLVGNAIKYTHHGSIEITMTRLPHQTRPGCEQVHFMVADTGPGIADEKMELIFESFSQADMSLSRRYSGSGIGLALVRRLIMLMGGGMCVSTQEKFGTEFHFSLALGRTGTLPVV